MQFKKRNNVLWGALLLALAPAAMAETSAWNGTALGFEAPQRGLLGDMLGIRPIIEDHGFHYNLGYLNQIGYNAGGGYDHDRHIAMIDQFALTFNQDLERWTGIPDARIEGNIVNRNHNDSLTTKRLQDPRVSFNDISQESWGGQSITRLGWLTFARSFDDRRLTWRIGMMNKVQTFDQIIPCDFQLLSQCGGKSANSLTWNNWNVHSWGTTLAYKLTPEVTLKGGVMEQNPQASSRSHAWSWSTKGSRGILLPVEIEARQHINGLPGAYNLGVLYTNANQADLYKGKSGGTGASDPDGYAEHSNTWFLYAGMNQQITRHSDDPLRGMSVSLSASRADARSNTMQTVAAASLRYRGLFDARPEDWIGMGVTWVDMSNDYARNQRALNQLSGVTAYSDPSYRPVPGHSVNAELYYRLRPASWLEVQPAVQYWHRPGGLAETQDAWVMALKTVVTF
ncbi:porin [Enterobacter sp. BIGb0383]|uniref:carbohydrate porin n=1 Tax=unclassified Enterobacter TaxID=2608935 RepID=UPI000F4870DF|nr:MULTISPECIES: carbohydrate porin [unclassified Enterobacter]ROP62800.1 porin [Enterobacter sp. BIGb0383]ROS12961.1 porin [Enterobacter sp. BIGb0359]